MYYQKIKEAHVMRIETKTGIDRKALAKSINEFCGSDIRYLGPPTFSYAIGGWVIDRNGVITSDSEDEVAELKAHLETAGFVEPQIEYMNITVPTDGMDGGQLRNLVFMLHSKQYLLNKAVGAVSFEVSERLVETLKNSAPVTQEEFMELAGQGITESRGISLGDGNLTFSFPFSEQPERCKAYTELSALMVAKAKDA